MSDIRPLTQRRSRQFHAQTWWLKEKLRKKLTKTGGSKFSEGAGRARIDGDRGLCFCQCCFFCICFGVYFWWVQAYPSCLLLHALVQEQQYISKTNIYQVCARVRQHTSAYVSIRQHTSACVHTPDVQHFKYVHPHILCIRIPTAVSGINVLETLLNTYYKKYVCVFCILPPNINIKYV